MKRLLHLVLPLVIILITTSSCGDDDIGTVEPYGDYYSDSQGILYDINTYNNTASIVDFTGKRIERYVTIPDDIYLDEESYPVVNIAPYAFTLTNEGANYSSLERVFFSSNSNIQTIDEGAFSQCFSLWFVELPKSLVYIDREAFLGCSSLESIDLSNCIYLSRIGESAFCGTDVDITLPAGSWAQFGQELTGSNPIVLCETDQSVSNDIIKWGE